jgi:hypothetical protein
MDMFPGQIWISLFSHWILIISWLRCTLSFMNYSKTSLLMSFFILKNNEHWVVGIFDEFWKTLLNRLSSKNLLWVSPDPNPKFVVSLPSPVLVEPSD